MTKPDIEFKKNANCWPTRQSHGQYVRWLVDQSGFPLFKNKATKPTTRAGNFYLPDLVEAHHRIQGLWLVTISILFKFRFDITFFSNLKTSTKKCFPMSCGGLPRHRNAKLQSLLACHAWQVACCLGSSWYEKICAKNGLWHLYIWKNDVLQIYI